jgi:MFS transporter, PPP family, 3-phenylpropionic acid transporter
MPGEGVPYWRLSSFYFLYFAFLGAMVPYWSLYLQGVGLDAAGIGLVLAAMAATRIVAPNLWGWLADRSGQRMLIIRLAALAAALSFGLLLLRHDLRWVLGVAVVHTFFWNAIMAQYEAVTLASLGTQVHRYGLVRLWGSVSFIVVVVLAGVLFDHVSILHLPWFLLLLLTLIVLGSLFVREPSSAPRQRSHGSLGEQLRNRVLLAFLAASFLLQFSHAPYYAFFSLLLERNGFSRAAIGQLWSIGVLAEIAIFAMTHRLLLRFSLRQILLASLLLAALRWLMIGLGAESLAVLVLAQCLHAASFASFHAAGIEFIRRQFGPGRQSQGQALYSAVSFGAGGALGALASGQVWHIDPRLAFLAAALAALLGWWVAQVSMRGERVETPGFPLVDAASRQDGE